MVAHVGHERPLDPQRGVVPADRAARGMLARVEPVSAERRQVDAPDKGHAAVHDDELLVVAVHRPLLRVEPDADPRPARERVAHLAHLGPRRVKERQRGARPREDTDVGAPGDVGEQLPQRRASPRAAKRRRERPAGEADGGARPCDRLLDTRQRLLAVDEQLDRVAGARPGLAGCPAAGRRREGTLPADPRESAPVVRSNEPLDALADRVVHPVDGDVRHGPEA